MNSNNINDNDNGKDDQNVLCDSIYQRRSIRKYKKEEISGEILEKIFDAARVAPSGKNRQPWKFLVYGGEEKKEILKKMRAGIKRELKEPLFKDSKRLLPDADGAREALYIISSINFLSILSGLYFLMLLLFSISCIIIPLFC